jgi:hypothetical protein
MWPGVEVIIRVIQQHALSVAFSCSYLTFHIVDCCAMLKAHGHLVLDEFTFIGWEQSHSCYTRVDQDPYRAWPPQREPGPSGAARLVAYFVDVSTFSSWFDLL